MAEMITGFSSLTSDALLALVREHAYGHQPHGRRVPRYLSLAFCNVLTVQAFADVQAALKAKDWIDRLACGHACQRWHAILDLETRQYVTSSLFDLFTSLYPPLIDLTARAPRFVQRYGPWRRLLFPGAGERGPWMHYAPHHTTWNFEYHTGNYRLYRIWDERVEDIGLEPLVEWLFYEVGHTLPPRQGHAMSLAGGQLWLKCPVPFAKPLVGSLHALLTTITRRCERAEARAAYGEAHPDVPRFHTINAGDLLRMPKELTQHDWWCGLRQDGEACTCTWPIEYGALTRPPTAPERR